MTPDFVPLSAALNFLQVQQANGFDYDEKDAELSSFSSLLAEQRVTHEQFANYWDKFFQTHFSLAPQYEQQAKYAGLFVADAARLSPELGFFRRFAFIYRAYYSGKRDLEPSNFEKIDALKERDPGGFFSLFDKIAASYEAAVDVGIKRSLGIIGAKQQSFLRAAIAADPDLYHPVLAHRFVSSSGSFPSSTFYALELLGICSEQEKRKLADVGEKVSESKLIAAIDVEYEALRDMWTAEKLRASEKISG